MTVLAVATAIGIFAYSKVIVNKVETFSSRDQRLFAFILIPLIINGVCRLQLLRISYRGGLERAKIGIFDWSITLLMVIGPILNLASAYMGSRLPYQLQFLDLVLIGLPAICVPESPNVLLIPSYMGGVLLVLL